jgi:hypothetical protein
MYKKIQNSSPRSMLWRRSQASGGVGQAFAGGDDLQRHAAVGARADPQLQALLRQHIPAGRPA